MKIIILSIHISFIVHVIDIRSAQSNKDDIIKLLLRKCSSNETSRKRTRKILIYLAAHYHLPNKRPLQTGEDLSET